MPRNKLPFAQLGQVVTRFPPRLHGLLRQITEAGSPAEEFQCYCSFVESLAKYLAHLCNSEYKNRPVDKADERLEATLRSISGNISFGHYTGSLRVFAVQLELDRLSIPALADVLGSRDFPETVARQAKAFQIMKEGRSEFEVPPRRLRSYVDKRLPGPKAAVKGTLDDFLSVIVEFRNRGVAHQDEDGWFPRDKAMYSLVAELLEPSLEALLVWPPMLELLTEYEIVEVDPRESWSTERGRACRIRKRQIVSGLAPFAPSELHLKAGLTAEGSYVARRTGDPLELEAVIRACEFPETLHSSEQLFRRYARQYLLTYLEHGLITPAQRENTLDPLVRKLSIAPGDQQRLELGIQRALNQDSDEDEQRRETLAQLQHILGAEWSQVEAEVVPVLERLTERRHSYVFDLINNNYIMSFEQVRAQTELNELDLQSVLADLEQERRVRRVGPGGDADIHQGHFKAQDPRRPEELRTILKGLEAGGTKKRRYPAVVWNLIKLCEVLLTEDGLALDQGEVDRLQELFEQTAVTPREEANAGGEQTSLVLVVGEEELRADSVRDLFERVWQYLIDHRVDARARLPYRLGRTRYLAHFEPVHANGTQFGVPCEVGGVYFEGNLPRSRALLEMGRFLRELGVLGTDVNADSPETEAVETGVHATLVEDDHTTQRGLRLADAGGGRPVLVQGGTVKGFLGELLATLLDRGALLDSIVPVRAGRVKYFLADEPYHDDGQRFEELVEQDGYFVNAGLTFDRALELSEELCRQLGLEVEPLDDVAQEAREEVELRIHIGDDVVDGKTVPAFLRGAVLSLYEQGILTDADMPLKVGRVRYLIAAVPRHDHGRLFIRPLELELGGQRYYIEANVSRRGAIDIVRDLITSKAVA